MELYLKRLVIEGLRLSSLVTTSDKEHSMQGSPQAGRAGGCGLGGVCDHINIWDATSKEIISVEGIGATLLKGRGENTAMILLSVACSIRTADIYTCIY